MTAKATDSSTPFPKFGKEQTEAMLGVQKELLEAKRAVFGLAVSRRK